MKTSSLYIINISFDKLILVLSHLLELCVEQKLALAIEKDFRPHFKKLLMFIKKFKLALSLPYMIIEINEKIHHYKL